MSLESNLELNNKLVAEQNGLLTKLLAALAGGKTFTADTPHQPKAETPVDKKDSAGPFYLRRTADGALNQVGTESARDSMLSDGYVEIGKAQFQQLKEEAEKTQVKPVSLEEQPLPVAVALAVLYGQASLTPEMMAHAVNITETTNGDERNAQIDALTMALKGVDRATKLHGAGVLDLALQMVEHWDALPGITERRAYADLLLDTPKEKRADVKPAKPKESAKGKNTETVTTTAGAEAPDAAALLDKGKQLIIQKIAPKAPADLRKTLDLFGLKKLTDCPEEKLPDVVAALEQLAESLEA
ncbi:hypothetical protein ACMD47_001832 [Serratia marcescens]|uniref:hypothetical protein n=1 Tax=Serratia sarumanii TaxID=3020826 RepID=UPI002AD182B7|nr:hypothetical protein [Serratia marcescens]EMC1043122.1 hypothetical protein [Serratia marcescens]HBV0684990.1 hypothetical protein [Serratia marcescens]